MKNTPQIDNTSSLSSNETNITISDLFQIDKVNNLNPEDFFIKFKKLYLDSNEKEIFDNIKNIQSRILKQDSYNSHLFFLKYFSIQFEKNSEEIIFLNKKIIQNSNSLKSFLDNISLSIYNKLSKILENKINDWYAWLTFTTEDILISKEESKSNLFWLKNKEIWEKLLYWNIRYLIIERWINFPQIKINNWVWMLFQEFSFSKFDSIFANLDNFLNKTNKQIPQLKEIKDFPSAKDFIIYCIKNFSWIKKENENSTDEFMISNHLWWYISDNINSFSFEDFKEILIESINIRWDFFHYMLNTEAPIIWELITWTKDLNKDEIEKISLTNLKKIYIKHYIQKQLDCWREFYLNTEENTFYLWTKSFEKILKESAKIKIESTKDKVKAFLWNETNLIEKMNSLLENNLSNNQEYLKNNTILIRSNSNISDIEKLINLISEQYLNDKNKIEIKEAENQNCINNDLLNIAIQSYKKQFKKLLKNWDKIYNDLLLWYDKHFLPIWWKIHFKNSLNENKIERLKSSFWFDSTPFQLQHANDSMLLPPCESPFQLVEVLNKLNKLWIIDDWDLELQLSVAWRLNNELSWILASSMIFLKNYQITYPKEAFETSHNEMTWGCIVCYDAWVLEKEWFSNIWDKIEWRTDILGTKKIEEVIVFSIISNLLSQAQFWWMHQKAWINFIKEYKQLLKKYNIYHILKWKWVHNPDKKEYNPEEYSEHSKLVNICTTILNESITQANKYWNKNTLIFKLRDLVWKYIRENWLLPHNTEKKISL